MSLDFNRKIRCGLTYVPFQPEAAMIEVEQARLLNLNRINSVKISPQEKSEAQIKLKTVERHLKLLKS